MKGISETLNLFGKGKTRRPLYKKVQKKIINQKFFIIFQMG